MVARESTGRRRSAWMVAGAVIGLLGVVLLAVAFFSRDPAPSPIAVPDVEQPPVARSSPSQSQDGPSSPSPSPSGMPDLVRGPVLPASPPLTIAIPRIHVDSPLETLGVDGSGAMDVPQDPAQAGWYRLGPAPGALGPAVIAGHVTWNQVPAVFYDLARLRPGDVVRVGRRDGRVAVFEVTRVERHEKTRFPTREVFGATDHAGLRLITCGGDFDASTHHYSDNVVVFARLASSV